MNHIYPNFFITHEREGKWLELQMGRSIEKCLSGTCPRFCQLAGGKALAASGDQHSTGGDEKPVAPRAVYCAWLVPLEGEPIGHYQMVEGDVGELGRVYNPYVLRSHLPSAQDGHPLARAYAPTKHALLSEFYRRGNRASYHFAKDEPPFEDELGRAERDAAMAIARANPEWLEVFKELSVDFLWSFTMLLEAQARDCAELEPTPPSAQARAILARDLRSLPFSSTSGEAA